MPHFQSPMCPRRTSSWTFLSEHIDPLEMRTLFVSKCRHSIGQWRNAISAATPLRKPQNPQLWKVWKTMAVPALIVWCCGFCKVKSRTPPFRISAELLDILNGCCPNTDVTTCVLICANIVVLLSLPSLQRLFFGLQSRPCVMIKTASNFHPITHSSSSSV